MILEITISVVAVFVTALLLYIKWSFNYWSKRNVYTPPVSFPFGNAKESLSGKENVGMMITNVYNDAKRQGLKYAGAHFIMKPIFVPVDINLLRNVLIADFQHFTDHSLPTTKKNDPLQAHLFTLTGAKWKALRIKLTPLFTSGKLKIMFQTLVNCTENFPYVVDEAIKESEPLDIKDTFARYTTDIIGSVAFGIDCNCLKNPHTEFRECGIKATKTGLREGLVQALTMLSPKLVDLFGIKLTNSDVEKFIMRVVKETIEYREKNNVEKKDFMQLLINLRNQDLTLNSNDGKDVTYYQNGLTLEEVAAQAFVFFLAGFETSSTTLNFLMYELVQDQSIQDKLREEINNALKAHNGNITYEAIQEMVYLDYCLNETLRKYPPLPVTPRVCTKDYKIPNSDLIIEKGIGVMIPIYGVHHDPEFYPDPEKFDPERFSDENKSKRPPGSFLAFGDGPRICIGLRMGVLQAKVGLVSLLRDYKFTLNSKTKVPLEFNGRDFVLTANGGVWVNAQRI